MMLRCSSLIRHVFHNLAPFHAHPKLGPIFFFSEEEYQWSEPIGDKGPPLLSLSLSDWAQTIGILLRCTVVGGKNRTLHTQTDFYHI